MCLAEPGSWHLGPKFYRYPRLWGLSKFARLQTVARVVFVTVLRGLACARGAKLLGAIASPSARFLVPALLRCYLPRRSTARRKSRPQITHNLNPIEKSVRQGFRRVGWRRHSLLPMEISQSQKSRPEAGSSCRCVGHSLEFFCRIQPQSIRSSVVAVCFSLAMRVSSCWLVDDC